MSIRLTPLAEVKKFYDTWLSEYSNIASRKRLMTREIKAHQEFIDNVAEAVNRTGDSQGWWHGDKYFPWHLKHYRNELKVMQDIRDNIGKAF